MTHNTREGIEEIEEHEMTDFERELAQAILGSLEYRGFYDCGKYLDTSFIEHIRPLFHQELQKAREEAMAREKQIKDIHTIELDTISCMSLERFVVWRDHRKQSELDQSN